MTPILYWPDADPDALIDVNSVPLFDVNDEQLFATGDYTAARTFDSYGRGALVDCISCEVTEERNGSYELTMEYPISGAHFDDMELRCIIMAQPNFNDDPQAFRIYSITAPIDGKVTILARHISYDLGGVPVLPFTATSCSAACAGLISYAAVDTPFTVGTTVGTIADFKADVPASVRSWFGGKEGSLIDVYGGEWWYDNYTCTLMSARGQDRGVVIRYGKNLIDFEQEKNCEEVYTGVLPYWYDEESGTQVRANIVNVAGVYDYRRILVLDMSMDFETKPTKAQLKAKAETYITANNIGVPKVNITLDWVQTSELTDRVDLCDTVLVEFERLGVSAKAKCISTTWDVLKDRYSRIEFGEPKTNITDTIAGLEQETEKATSSVSPVMLGAIQRATAAITGNTGGYTVQYDSNGDGKPDEFLILNTPDISTATKVWRWNLSGLGYSNSGYNGTFGLAMTMDGEIVADYITTGTLSAVDIDGVNITGSTITGTTINNGSGTFIVDASGNVTANSLVSSNATITGGSIIINSANLGQVLQLINPNAPAYHKIGPNVTVCADTDGINSSTTWYRMFSSGNITVTGRLSEASGYVSRGASEYWTTGNLYLTGYTTTGSRDINFFIPSSKPITATGASVTSLSITVRQNGGYPFARSGSNGTTYTQLGSGSISVWSGSASTRTNEVESISTGVRTDGINVAVRFTYAPVTTSGGSTAMANNAPIGLNVSATILFS